MLMTALNIQNKDNEILIRLNRNSFDETYLISLVKRLNLEAIAKEAQIDKKVLVIADEIDTDWWSKNGDEFLRDVKRS
jgi:hypothetical protein